MASGGFVVSWRVRKKNTPVTCIFFPGRMDFIIVLLYNRIFDFRIQGRQLLAKVRVTINWDGAEVERTASIRGRVLAVETNGGVTHVRAGEGRAIKVTTSSECSFVGNSKEVKRVTRALGGRGSDNGGGSEVAHEGLVSFTFFEN